MQPLTVTSFRLLVGDNSPLGYSVRIRSVGCVPGWRTTRVLKFVAAHGCVEVHADDARVGGFVRISHEDFKSLVASAKVESDPLDPVTDWVLDGIAEWARTKVIREYTRFPAFSNASHTTFPVSINGGSHVVP